jgi:hypothetical protein
MALETATYISDLVETNPAGSDVKSQGDDHLKMLKRVVKATFPNVTGAVNATHTQLNSFITPAMVDISDAGSTITWNVTNAPFAKITLDGNKTFAAPTGLNIGWKYLVITQGATARTITWNAAFKMPGRSGGYPPDLGVALETTVVAGFYDGVNFWVGYTPY